MAKSDVQSFIKKHLKYRAGKCYVGNLSGVLLHDLRNKIMETEVSGYGHLINVGYIDVDLLRAALKREMSYNPLRFFKQVGSVYAANTPEADAIDAITLMLQEFMFLWPTGIREQVRIIDFADAKYLVLLKVRDCFKKIANINMQDFKSAAYRDETVAAFAAAQIPMPAALRAEMTDMAVASAMRRAHKRDIAELNMRIKAIETEIKIHRGHDAVFVAELKLELEELKARLDLMINKKQPRALSTQRRAPSIANRPNVQVAPTVAADENYGEDAYDREVELLSTLTPEHDMGKTPDVFIEYIAEHGIERR